MDLDEKRLVDVISLLSFGRVRDFVGTVDSTLIRKT